jgi:hypothetical protein
MPAGTALVCSDIERYLGEEEERVHALRGISLTLEAGTVHAVVGPSGCGKSTLLYIPRPARSSRSRRGRNRIAGCISLVPKLHLGTREQNRLSEVSTACKATASSSRIRTNCALANSLGCEWSEVCRQQRHGDSGAGMDLDPEMSLLAATSLSIYRDVMGTSSVPGKAGTSSQIL